MNLIEEFNMDDSLGLNGFVVITNNKTGEILLKKHNMILAGAKKVLLSKLLCNSNGTSAINGLDLNELGLLQKKENYLYRDYYIAYCKFYNDENEVTYTEKINHSRPTENESQEGNQSSTKNPFILEFSLDSSTVGTANIHSANDVNCDGTLTTSIETVDNHYRLKYTVNLTTDQEEPIKFTSLSLVMDHPDNKGNEIDLEIPFSRIKFDPIILTQESSLNLTYYVYF